MTLFADLPEFDQRDDIEQLLHEVRTHLIIQQFPDRLLSVQEACDLLNVSRSTLYKMMDAGELAYVERYGRGVPRSAALRWIETHTTKATDAVYSASAARRKEY